jgi:hypothetical protein
MASHAKRPQIIQVALSSTLRHRDDMVRFPQRPAARNPLHPIEPQPRRALLSPSPPQRRKDRHRIRRTPRAHPTVPRKHPLPHIPRIGPQFPLVDAVIRAESPPPLRQDLKVAPTAKRQPIRPARQLRRPHPAARHRPRDPLGYDSQRCLRIDSIYIHEKRISTSESNPRCLSGFHPSQAHLPRQTRRHPRLHTLHPTRRSHPP